MLYLYLLRYGNKSTRREATKSLKFLSPASRVWSLTNYESQSRHLPPDAVPTMPRWSRGMWAFKFPRGFRGFRSAFPGNPVLYILGFQSSVFTVCLLPFKPEAMWLSLFVAVLSTWATHEWPGGVAVVMAHLINSPRFTTTQTNLSMKSCQLCFTDRGACVLLKALEL